MKLRVYYVLIKIILINIFWIIVIIEYFRIHVL